MTPLDHSAQILTHDTDRSPFTTPLPLPSTAPNSSRKRRPLDLARRTPESSHSDKISAIFEDAGRALYATPTKRLLQANARRIRMPFLATGADRKACFAEASRLNDVSPGKENLPPVEEGQSDSSIPAVVYPDLTKLQRSFENTHLPTVTEQRDPSDNPHYPVSDIESWLKQIPDDRTSEFIERPEGSPTPGPSRRNLPCTPPFAGDQRSRQIPTRLWHPLTSSPYLSAPPKRKARRLSPKKSGSLAGPDNWEFDIHEDESSEGLVELSPSVEKYRKGRRPKRERCVSYWDEDIHPRSSGKTGSSKQADSDRQPLGEIPSLTKAKGFVRGVEDAEFDFNIPLDTRNAEQSNHVDHKQA
ncbi:MAG: hypothetical protein Q9172_002156 [Xanthocarpia lactea]